MSFVYPGHGRQLAAPLLWALVAGALASSSAGADALALGRTYSDAFLAGSLDQIAAAFDPQLANAMPDEKLAAFQSTCVTQLGTMVEILDETTGPKGTLTEFVRLARFEKRPELVEMCWAFTPDEAIAGFTVRPSSRPHPSDFLDYEPRTTLRLPFDETWYVFWGGRSLEENHHAATRDQRFALDLVIERDGTTHGGDGDRNEDYFCYGAPLLSPAPGQIVAVLDGIPDNVPGETNAAQPLGNHVIIDHGNGEFSFLAHLRPGTIRVTAGDVVEAGTLLGTCGNSGNSSEPHLHYHLQNSAIVGDGDGLPARFTDFQVGDEHVERGEPVKGQSIAAG